MKNINACFAAGVMMIIMLAALLIPGGCALFDTTEGQAAPVEELDGRLVQANNRLGFKIMDELSNGNSDNIFISPSSILTALAMTYNGAEGETRRAMEKTLGFEEMPLEEINSAFADLLTLLNNPDPQVELALANSLWAREGVDFHRDFLERNSEYYKAEVTEIDFDQDDAADIINSWVKDNTGGKIEDLVESPIDTDSILFLINAIYFKGEWTNKFDPDETRVVPFTLADGSQTDHPLMFKYSSFDYFQSDLFQAVRLPYGENERLGMFIFLPREGVSKEELYRKLQDEPWKKQTEKFYSMEGEIGLPRFQFEYEVSLNDTLESLGMGIAFDQDQADFSRMRPIPPELFISEVKHKSFVEVNEEGTEAAAATSVEIAVTSMPETFSMIIDRPFIFTIADNMTGTILFMGEVTNP